MNDIAIKVENLTKIYPLYNSPKDRMKEALHPFRKKYHHDFYALKDVSFEIKKGETVGIIGKNGAGKSTLLKILTGVLTPTSGNVKVNGRISSLLELGTGFNPELSGLENIYFYGTVNGISRKEMEEKKDEILEFADIGEFIHQPVKTYSSGMFARLAFSVATSIDPEILIVDEVLSVGDMFFQAKCAIKMKKMIEEKKCTLLFVSHDMRSVKSLCSRGILVEGGIAKLNDKVSIVAESYIQSMRRTSQGIVAEQKLKDAELIKKKIKTNTSTISSKTKYKYHELFIPDPEFEKRAAFERVQNGKAKIVKVMLVDECDNELLEVEYGQKVKIQVAIEILKNLELLTFGYVIKNNNGIHVINSNSSFFKKYICSAKKNEKYFIELHLKMILSEGNYSIQFLCSIPSEKPGIVEFCDIIPTAICFSMRPRKEGPLYGFTRFRDEICQLKKIEF